MKLRWLRLEFISFLVCASACTPAFRPTLDEAASESVTRDERNSLDPIVKGTLAIQRPLANAMTQSKIKIEGTCITDIPVEVSGTGVATAIEIACTAELFSAEVVLSEGEGIKNVLVAQSLGLDRKLESRSFIKDSLPPLLQILVPEENTAAKTGLQLSGACENNLVVQIYGPGVDMPTMVPCANGMFTAPANFSAIDGVKVVYLAQTDAAGNVGNLTRQFGRDNVPPLLTIISPVESAIVQGSVALAGACETGLNVEVSGPGVLAPVSQVCTGGQYSISAVLTAAAGAKNLVVTEVDRAGNQSRLNRNVVRNNPGLVIAISQPAQTTIAKTGVTLQGSCVTGLSVTISGTGLLSATSTSCVSATFSAPILFSAGDGAKNIVVSQVDAVGSTGMDSRSFFRDTTAPLLNISTPSNNALVQSSITAIGTCESGLSVTISGAVDPASLTCTAGMFSGALNLSAVDGAKVIQISQTDAVGNVTTKTLTVIRDTTAPLLTLTAPAAGTIGITGVTLQGACEIGRNVDVSGAGVTAPISQACPSGNYSIAILFSEKDGAKNIVVSQTDAPGNKASISRDFIRETPVLPPNGPNLYTANCASCHGQLEQSTKRNRSSGLIAAAISGVSSMNALNFLTSQEVAAIALALQDKIPITPQVCVPAKVQKPVVRRLNAREFSNSVRDFIGVTINQKSLPADDLNGMGFDTDGGILRLSDLDSQKYLDTIQSSLDMAFASSTNSFSCATAGSAEAAKRSCTMTKLSSLLNRAYKKSVTSAELNFMVDFARTETDVNDGLKKAMAAAFLSPNFLYLRSDTAAALAGSAVYSLNGIELAHKLSLMLWSSVPDDNLMAAATAGQLSNSTNLRAQVSRMVADPKFGTGLGQGFVDNWLELSRLSGMAKSNTEIAGFSEQYMSDMIIESRLFVQHLVRNNRPLSELFSAQYSFLNKRLAQVYGSVGTFTDTEFKMTMLPVGERSGILTQPSVMTVTSKIDSTSPIKRGHWATKRVLCSEPPPPPANVPGLPENPSSTLTVKQRLAAHRSNISCSGCHTQMDPIGIGLENFSQVGKWRTSYGSMPVDATEFFDSKAFNGPIELGGILADRADVKICFTKHVATYSLGRVAQIDDSCYLDEIIRKSDPSSSGLLTVIQELVDSPLFKQHKVSE